MTKIELKFTSGLVAKMSVPHLSILSIMTTPNAKIVLPLQNRRASFPNTKFCSEVKTKAHQIRTLAKREKHDSTQHRKTFLNNNDNK